MTKPNEHLKPDYAIPPGEILLETLDARGMTRKELATCIGLPEKHVTAVLEGDAPITPRLAWQFEKVLGVPESFWNNLEKNYKDALARLEQEKLP